MMVYTRFMAYVIGMFLLSGLALLVVDQRVYQANGMVKERRAARILGWIQLCLSLLSLAGSLALLLLN